MPKHQKKAAIPPEPLTFAHGQTVPGPSFDGAVLVPELPPEHALVVLRVYRTLRMCARWGWLMGPALTDERVEEWEHQVLRDVDVRYQERPDDRHLQLITAVASMFSDLRHAEETEINELYDSSMHVSEWGLQHERNEVTVAFPAATALLWVDNARMAWLAGKLSRTRGMLREAEYWFRRADRVATWHKDPEGKARALNSLGNLHWEVGSYDRAEALYQRALRISQRHHLSEREGAASHDLFIARYTRGDLKGAAEFAYRAFSRYGGDHPNLPKLAHDIATFWMAQGHFSAAQSVFKALLPHFTEPAERIRVVGSAARAAGTCKDPAFFELLWTELWDLVDRTSDSSPLGAALTEVGLGAVNLEYWDHASEALERAVEIAKIRGESDVLVRAGEALNLARKRAHPAELGLERTPRRALHAVTSFAGELVNSLKDHTRTSSPLD